MRSHQVLWSYFKELHYHSWKSMWNIEEPLAVAPTTGPLEQSYSKLPKICYKDRNQLSVNSLETFYLLSAPKNPQINNTKAINILEK